MKVRTVKYNWIVKRTSKLTKRNSNKKIDGYLHGQNDDDYQTCINLKKKLKQSDILIIYIVDIPI